MSISPNLSGGDGYSFFAFVNQHILRNPYYETSGFL